jgi:glycosyltransferase involved in cell wall biosynthesis
LINCFKESNCEANLVVSHFHKQQTVDTLVKYGYSGSPPTQVIYNPIDDNLKPDSTPYDKNQLCFISSPHKGLDYALDIFGHLQKLNPDFRLHVTNPGYFPDSGKKPPGVVLHGSVSRNEVATLLRTSLCLFYPNIVFPETFGLVLAEANAVGTPVLTHRMGAAAEVCDVPSTEVIDCRDPNEVIKQVMYWRDGARPTVRGKSQFRLARVIQAWVREILN